MDNGILDISNPHCEKDKMLERFGVQPYSALEAQEILQDYYEEAVEDARKRLVDYVNTHRVRLLSESNIFGTVTFEVLARHVAIVVNYSQAKGINLLEVVYNEPLRRNTLVSLTYQSNEIGIINMPI